MEAKKQYKKGYFVEMGLATGIPFGIPLGLVLGNIALGPLLGVFIGLGTGFLMEKIFNKNRAEPSEKESVNRNKLSRTGIIAGLVLFLTLAVIYSSIKLF